MIQVCRWIPMHADLARNMPLRFPVQSCSMCGFRVFYAKPQIACFRAFHAKPQIACFRAFASRANAVSGKCGFPSSAAPVESSFPCECCFRASAPVLEPYRHELSFCASTCASVRGQEHYHKSAISSTFLVFSLDFRAKSRGILPKIFLWHQCFGRYFRNKAIFS